MCYPFGMPPIMGPYPPIYPILPPMTMGPPIIYPPTANADEYVEHASEGEHAEGHEGGGHGGGHGGHHEAEPIKLSTLLWAGAGGVAGWLGAQRFLPSPEEAMDRALERRGPEAFRYASSIPKLLTAGKVAGAVVGAWLTVKIAKKLGGLLDGSHGGGGH